MIVPSLQDLTSQRQIDPSDLPKVTILIPALNCSQPLTITLESIARQEYPRYEIIVIDAGSTDRTLEIVHSYHMLIRIVSALNYDIYLMINQGIALAEGEYINVLFPGDFYIDRRTLWQLMTQAIEEKKPDLIYCATLLRELNSENKFLFRPLTFSLLKRGQQPTSLQACWFKKDLFQVLGGFRTDYHMRAGFDFFCRFCLQPSLRFASLKRAFIDFDLRRVTSKMVIRHFLETAQTIYAYFGKRALLRWLLSQKDISRFVKLWIKQVRMAFIERH